jgi:hypothetical protein
MRLPPSPREPSRAIAGPLKSGGPSRGGRQQAAWWKACRINAYSEVQLETLCKEKYNGRGIGGGTNLSNGKRDQQFVFEKLTDAKGFLKHPFTKAVTLKDYDLVEVD